MILILYRIYQFCIAFPLLIVITIVTALTTAAGCIITRDRRWGYYPPHFWAKAFCVLTFVKVTVSGRENIRDGKSYIFVANHQGAYDIFSVYGYLNHEFKWMMKKSLERIPFVGLACRCAGHIFVDNSNSAALLHTMHAAEAELRDGDSLVVFPEGSRTYNGKMGRFKRGAYQLAREFQLPMVPVTIDGAFSVLPRTSLLPHWGHIHLTIHPPVNPPQPDEELTETMTKTYDLIHSALPSKWQ